MAALQQQEYAYPMKIVCTGVYLYTQECAVYIYSICFSTIISCSYWKNQTLSDIIEHAIEMYNDETINGKSQPSENFPGSIQILI